MLANATEPSDVAGHERRQQLARERVVVGQRQRAAREHRAGEERRRDDRAAELVQHHREVRVARTAAAELRRRRGCSSTRARPSGPTARGRTRALRRPPRGPARTDDSRLEQAARRRAKLVAFVRSESDIGAAYRRQTEHALADDVPHDLARAAADRPTERVHVVDHPEPGLPSGGLERAAGRAGRATPWRSVTSRMSFASSSV